MNKILIATDDKTDIDDIASMTVSDKRFVSIIYRNGRTVQYLYNPHFDIDSHGKSAYERSKESNER